MNARHNAARFSRSIMTAKTLDAAQMKDLIDQVKKYAMENYNHGGWGHVVECYEDAEIQKKLEEGKCTTLKEAVKKMGHILGILDEVRKERMAAADAEYVAAGLPPFWNRGDA